MLVEKHWPQLIFSLKAKENKWSTEMIGSLECWIPEGAQLERQEAGETTLTTLHYDWSQIDSH